MEDLLETYWPDEHEILAQVDEYWLYSAYLGFEPWPGKAYVSPVRPDINADAIPSWDLRLRKVPRGNIQFRWTDYATGQNGDIYDLIRCMESRNGELMTRKHAIWKVRDDLRTGTFTVPAPGVIAIPAGFGQDKDIRVRSRPMTDRELLYWSQIGVNLPQLSKYHITAISHSWTDGKIKYHGEMSFAYRIGRRYQLYKPYAAKDRKFRNNLTEHDLPGWEQLPAKGKLCIIGKANKEVAAQDAWGFPSVAPRGENIPIPKHFLDQLEARFDRIVTLFDNDGKHQKLPQYEELHIPIETGEKDPTDFARKFGVPMAIELLRDLLKI